MSSHWHRPVLVAVCGLALAGCGASETERPVTATTASPTVSPDRPAERPSRPQRGEVTVAGRTVVGEWEDGELLGEPLVVDGREVVYAAQRDGRPAYVATGVRSGSALLRTITVVPDVGALRGLALYGGNVLGERAADDHVTGGTYLVVGVAPGRVQLSVSGRPVSGQSHAALPGRTVFYDSGAWEPGWDQVRLAPLTVSTDDGRSARVRTRSWTG